MSTKLALKIPQTEAEHRSLGDQLTSQYEKATAGMAEYIAFGALALNVREAINSARGVDTRPGGKESKGSGLKAWLASYAPTVTESTAYRYIELAESVKQELGIGESVDLHHLLKDEKLTPAEKARKGKILALVEGKSQRQLLISIGKYEAPAKATKSKKLTPEEEQAEFMESARVTAVTTLGSFHTLQDRWKLLTDPQIKLAIANAERFAKQAKKWLETPAPSRGEFDASRHLKGEMDEDLALLNQQLQDAVEAKA